MAKGKKNEKTIDADEAVRRAYSAAADVKPKDEGLYWATVAQTLLLSEIRDMMREDRTNHGSVELPEQAPPRETAQTEVIED